MKGLTGLVLAAVFLAFGWGAQAGQKDSRLDGLFDRLQAVTDQDEAREIQGAIWRIWIDAGDETVDAEMLRGIAEMKIGDMPAALKRFNAVIGIAPDHAEGWNKRATVLYFMGDYDGSVRDIGRTLALEPRHWGALSGLGMIHMRSGKLQAAIKALEDAVAINPHMSGTKLRIKQLKKIAKGKPI